ncbi:MAG: HrcA family transcriptional regulator, partial [Candidatus Nanopelagicales bacterium]
VVISTTGQVEQRVVDIATPLADETVAELRNRLNESLAGQLVGDVPAAAEQVANAMDEETRPAALAVVSTMIESLAEESEERVVLAGTANLALFGSDFPQTIRPVLEALEEHVVLLQLLGEATAPSEVHVRIGHEILIEGLSSTSLVSAAYGDAAPGRLGVIGPTRMDYPGTIGAVRAVATYVGRILEESP